jgi:D-glycero-D-manno-heptose 1,7-bisphosphate phosphatase
MISLAAAGVYFDGEQPPAPFPTGQCKALFLDRDGIINANHGYVHTAAGTDWVEGIFELCRAARQAGYILVVVTNQAGIARGYYSESQFLDYTRWMHAEFAARGVPLAATWYCPHHPQGELAQYRTDCTCRKPGPAMILAAAQALNIDLAASMLVGDQPSDIAAASAAGVGRAVLLSSDTLPGLQAEGAQVGSLMDAWRVLTAGDKESPGHQPM